MQNNRFRTTALLLLAVTIPIAAIEYTLSADHDSCLMASGGNTFKMLDCDTNETKRQDAKLNRAYIAIMKRLSGPRKEQLRTAQRLWIKYRDANCDFYYDPQGGQAVRLAASSCYLSETAARAAEIEMLARMEE